MSDILDDLDIEFAGSFDVCQKPLGDSICAIPLPVGHHPSRKYCDDHQPAASKPKKKIKTSEGEVPPKSININIKGPQAKKPKANSDGQAVQDGAERMLGLLPLIFAMSGDTQCAEALSNGIPQIAAQLGALTEYHPGLKKIFAPGESTGEAMAWIGLTIAVAPVIIAILAHHDLISPKMAQTFAVFSTMASGAEPDGE